MEVPWLLGLFYINNVAKKDMQRIIEGRRRVNLSPILGIVRKSLKEKRGVSATKPVEKGNSTVVYGCKMPPMRKSP